MIEIEKEIRYSVYMTEVVAYHVIEYKVNKAQKSCVVRATVTKKLGRVGIEVFFKIFFVQKVSQNSENP